MENTGGKRLCCSPNCYYTYTANDQCYQSRINVSTLEAEADHCCINCGKDLLLISPETLERNEICEDSDKQSTLPTTIRVVELSVIPDFFFLFCNFSESNSLENESYQCQHCDKQFTQRSSLKRNLEIHSGEKA